MASLKLLELLEKAFGKTFINQSIGTRTNVVKPIKLDKNAPTKGLYSPEAFENPKTMDIIEEKLMEYAPFQLANKNSNEVAQYTANLEMYLKAKNKQMGVTEGMKSVKAAKPEAEVIDMKTGIKLDDDGIKSLKQADGLPPEVEPGSNLAKLKEKINQVKNNAQKLSEDAGKSKFDMNDIAKAFFDIGAKQGSIQQEGRRRAVMRKILLADERLNLPDDVIQSLKRMDDLKGDGPDPLELFNQYYVRDNYKLDTLDDIIDGAQGPNEAATEFLKEIGFDLKPPRDTKAEGGLSYLMGE